MEYLGNCVGNPFGSVDRLQDIIDGGKKVSRKKFLESVGEALDDFDFYGVNVVKQMKTYNQDFGYFYNKKKKIWFFEHSCIEYFFR